jgi:hypothetical protein
MDYPQLNLIFGLGLVIVEMVNIGLRVLLSKVRLAGWMNTLSWLVLIISILSALYIEYLFLRLMTPAFNWQLIVGALLIGAIGALVTARLYQKATLLHIQWVMFAAQIIVSLVSMALAFGLYRSLVPIGSP